MPRRATTGRGKEQLRHDHFTTSHIAVGRLARVAGLMSLPSGSKVAGPEPSLTAGEPLASVAPGQYIVLVEKAEVGRGWPDRRTGQPKRALYLHCTILAGPFSGTKLFMPMNITFKSRHPRPSSAFYEAWTVAMDRKPLRGEPMSREAFEGKVFQAEVRTVVRDGQGQVRPEVAQYSKVARLLRLLGARDGWLRPETEYGTLETINPIPPSPQNSATTGWIPPEKDWHGFRRSGWASDRRIREARRQAGGQATRSNQGSLPPRRPNGNLHQKVARDHESSQC